MHEARKVLEEPVQKICKGLDTLDTIRPLEHGTTPERVKFLGGGVQAVIAFCLNKPSPCPCSNAV
jgi:hypothetical protein